MAIHVAAQYILARDGPAARRREGTGLLTGPRRLDVICPVFREELGIERFDTELWGVLDSLKGYQCHVMYVLDPYPGDGTQAQLESCADQRHKALIEIKTSFI